MALAENLVSAYRLGCVSKSGFSVRWVSRRSLMGTGPKHRTTDLNVGPASGQQGNNKKLYAERKARLPFRNSACHVIVRTLQTDTYALALSILELLTTKPAITHSDDPAQMLEQMERMVMLSLPAPKHDLRDWLKQVCRSLAK